MAFVNKFLLACALVLVLNMDATDICSTKINLKEPLFKVPLIYGGNSAHEGQFPFMVFVLYQIGDVWAACSASLVRDDVVLLAAHCLKTRKKKVNPNKIIAVAGQTQLLRYQLMRAVLPWGDDVDEKEFGLQERRAIAAKKHPLFDPETYTYDIGLIQVDKPFILSSLVKPIRLSPVKLKNRRSCTILGWGRQENEYERRLFFAHGVVARPGFLGCENGPDSSPFICLEQKNSGTCAGDSGSPLVCAGKVWGVALHVLTVNGTSSCGKDYAELYVDIHDGLDFIVKFLEKAQLRRLAYDHTTDVIDRSSENSAVFHKFSLTVLSLLLCYQCTN